MEASYRPATPGQGWAAFAGCLILVLGVFNVIYGIVGIVDDDYFVEDGLLFGDLTMWGWILLIIGVIQILVALGIFAGNALAAIIGIAGAMLNAIGHLLAIEAYPLWSIIIIVIDGLVIYALTVYGTSLRET
jgi:hypothetical protein